MSDSNKDLRPDSTVSRSFSASLNDAFAMDKNLEGLAQSVEQKKQAVTSQSQELEALEARLRETEEKLKQKTSRPSSSSRKMSGHTTPHRRQPAAPVFDPQESQTRTSSATQQSASAGGFSPSGGSRWEGLLPTERGSRA